MNSVPRVIETISKLLQQRPSELLNIFSSISKRGRNIHARNISLGGSLIFSISDGKETGTDFTNWRFRLLPESTVGNYFEVWRNIGKDKYFLDRAYFNIYAIEDLKEFEYILLHCDACEPDGGKRAIYKQSPHLHIKVSPDPIPKAHFALYCDRINIILKDVTSFNNALAASIEMLDLEILRSM